MKLRTANDHHAYNLTFAIKRLREARDALKFADCPKTLRRVRLALTSAGGAERSHAPEAAPVMSLTLPDLIAELQRSPYQHRLTMTNVEQVTSSGADLILETDTSNLQSHFSPPDKLLINQTEQEVDNEE